MNTSSRFSRLSLFALLLILFFGLFINVGAEPFEVAGLNNLFLPVINHRQGPENWRLLDGLDSPSSLRFAPDGRLFISERITGKLLIAHKNASTGDWVLQAQPFYTFDTPKDNGVPAPYASGGLRDIVFDPNFTSNGYIYAYYMKDSTRHNRVVRIQASANKNLAIPTSETLLFELPFNDSVSSGSHNGGALQFGPDGKLYFTTGDGFSTGDPVQSLTTYTGKLYRINANGSIPTDNPFYNQTTGNYRAIYALGLRNPFSMSVHPQTNQMYINDVTSSNNKAVVYLVQEGTNYRHRGSNDSNVLDTGSQTSAWARPGNAGGEVLTGGDWVLPSGPFSDDYPGAYFTALWGSNNDLNGQFNYITSDSDNTAVSLLENIGFQDSNGLAIKPTHLRRGPDGYFYYLLSTYQTSEGELWMLRP